ncbi:hypothetical protein RFI_13366, partial [Reticulomyxa filosa]
KVVKLGSKKDNKSLFRTPLIQNKQFNIEHIYDEPIVWIGCDPYNSATSYHRVETFQDTSFSSDSDTLHARISNEFQAAVPINMTTKKDARTPQQQQKKSDVDAKQASTYVRITDTPNLLLIDNSSLNTSETNSKISIPSLAKHCNVLPYCVWKFEPVLRPETSVAGRVVLAVKNMHTGKYLRIRKFNPSDDRVDGDDDVVIDCNGDVANISCHFVVLPVVRLQSLQYASLIFFFF